MKQRRENDSIAVTIPAGIEASLTVPAYFGLIGGELRVSKKPVISNLVNGKYASIAHLKRSIDPQSGIVETTFNAFDFLPFKGKVLAHIFEEPGRKPKVMVKDISHTTGLSITDLRMMAKGEYGVDVSGTELGSLVMGLVRLTEKTAKRRRKKI